MGFHTQGARCTLEPAHLSVWSIDRLHQLMGETLKHAESDSAGAGRVPEVCVLNRCPQVTVTRAEVGLAPFQMPRLVERAQALQGDKSLPKLGCQAASLGAG